MDAHSLAKDDADTCDLLVVTWLRSLGQLNGVGDDTDDLGQREALFGHAPQPRQGTHAHAQLFPRYRFVEKLVSPALEPLELVHESRQYRQHDDGRRAQPLRRANLLHDLEPVDIGQKPVQQNDVEVIAGSLLDAFPTRPNPGDLVSPAAQLLRQCHPIDCAVLDDKHWRLITLSLTFTREEDQLDPANHVVIGDGFDNVVERPHLHRLHDVVVLADGRHNDDGDVLGRQGGAKSFENCQAGDVREAEIQQDKAGLFLDSQVDAFPASTCGDGCIARSSQHISVQTQAFDVVVDYQHLSFHQRTPGSVLVHRPLPTSVRKQIFSTAFPAILL